MKTGEIESIHPLLDFVALYHGNGQLNLVNSFNLVYTRDAIKPVFWHWASQ